jgi:glyoxylate reductase
MLGSDVFGKTLGVVGAGRIGEEVLRRGAGFGMKLLYHNRNRNEDMERELGASHVDLMALMRESDFVSLHVPLTPETDGMIGAEELGAMKSTAFLVNTSRGEVLDEEALIGALRKGSIAGAGLDVYMGEPHVDPRLMAQKNTVLLPHVGSGTRSSREAMARLSVKNIALVCQGKKPDNLVNARVWGRRRELS